MAIVAGEDPSRGAAGVASFWTLRDATGRSRCHQQAEKAPGHESD
jgi:hypothetical protein